MCRFVKMLKNFALGCVVGLLPLACVTVAASPSSEMRQVRGQTEDRTAVASQQSPAGNAVDDPLSEKQQRIKTYIENMTYMVYFNEESQEDPFLMGSAVGSANRYLAEGGFEAVNLSQIEQLKKDQMRVFRPHRPPVASSRSQSQLDHPVSPNTRASSSIARTPGSPFRPRRPMASV